MQRGSVRAFQPLPLTMQALLKAEAAPGATLMEVPVPKVGPEDALIRVEAASICGTDLHIFSWDEWAQGRIHPPLIIGHEFAGTVVALGEEVRGVPVGEYVAAESHIACGDCYECRH